MRQPCGPAPAVNLTDFLRRMRHVICHKSDSSFAVFGQLDNSAQMMHDACWHLREYYGEQYSLFQDG